MLSLIETYSNLTMERFDMKNKQLLTVSEAADKLGVCKKTIRDWTNDGRLPCIRTLGGHRRLRMDDIDLLLEVNDGKQD